MAAPPRKPVHEVSEAELTASDTTGPEPRDWKRRLFTQGVNPIPIREDASPSVSSYGWDPDLRATVEHADGNRYLVGIRDGKLVRGALVEPVIETGSAGPRTRKAHPNLPVVRKRKLA
jgi:hypothetical protein